MSQVLARATTVPATRATTLLAAGCATVALSACGASFQPLVYEERATAGASNVGVGDIAVRNVTVLGPERGYVHEAGENVFVSMALVNTSREGDRLVEASTDAATAVVLLDGRRPVDAIVVPPEGALVEEVGLGLAGLTRQLQTGDYIELTLLFEDSGSETFLVPVGPPEETPEREHSENIHSEEEE